jgi:hypothetical protein
MSALADAVAALAPVARPLKKQRVVKRKVPFAKETETLMLLFDGRDVLQEDELARVMLPAVNNILLRMENDDKLAAKKINLARYSFHVKISEEPYGGSKFQKVEPKTGMIIATNKDWKRGMHYDWKFYRVTNITEKGTVVVKELRKVTVPDHPLNQADHFFQKRYVAPVLDDAPGGAKPKMLERMNFQVWSQQSSFYDGGVVN